MPVRSLVRRLVVLLLLCTAVGGAGARDVQDLYGARVAVGDRSPGELARAAREALGVVLIKLTGDRGAPRGAAAPLLKNASKLLLKYAYAPAADGRGLELVAEFDEPALAAALAAQSVPMWGKERPDTLAWLVVDEAGRRDVASSDEPGLRGEVLKLRAARRGVPLLMPLMDIEEAQHLGQAADWDAIATTAMALSARYGTPAALVGYLRPSAPGFWVADWRLQLGADTLSWREEGDLAELMLDDGIDALADALAERYANPSELARDETLELAIVGIESAEDYARVIDYLNGLDTVARLFVHGVGAAGLRVEVAARGGQQGLASSIAFGRVLVPVAGRANAFQVLR
ncbi:MAG: DUF2066 domain-containing protein [Gammaproteobacteria bacterium]